MEIENKYTSKIINFLSGNFATYLNKYNLLPNHPIIHQIQNIYLETTNECDLKLKTFAEYTRLHHINDDCLTFIIFKELYEDKLLSEIQIEKNDLENMSSFAKWHRLNHNKINLHNFLKTIVTLHSKYKKFYDVLFFPVFSRKDLHQLLYKNSFISMDNVHHAESTNILYKRYKNKSIDLSIYSPANENSENKFAEPDINLINKIFKFMSKVFKKPDLKLKLVVFYGNQKKLIDFETNLKNRTLCSDNVNSGLSVKEELIMIWRKEEFYKVFIHELVHFFGIDFYILDPIYNLLDSLIKSKYKIIGSDKINESYTEALAIFLHSVVFSIEKNKNLDDVMRYEIMFSHFQMAKILNYFNCASFEDLEKVKIKQNTSVFSYYIIKTILMVNYQVLFDFWFENGFQILNGNEQKYEQLYTKIINKNNIDSDTLNFFINYIRNNVDKESDTFIFRTLRMSCFSF